jgi:hypothetical protein
MCYLKNLPVKGLCGRRFISPPCDNILPPPAPPYTLYTCLQYTYSHRDGGGR